MSSEPDSTSLTLTPADDFMVLASDGVWEFMSNDEVVALLAECDTAEAGCRKVGSGHDLYDDDLFVCTSLVSLLCFIHDLLLVS